MDNTLKARTLGIKINNEKYFYEIYQMFNIYYQNLKIEMNPDNYQYDIFVEDNHIKLSDGEIESEFSLSPSDFKGDMRRAVFAFLKEVTNKRYPWGTLIGIRPSKMAMKMMNEGYEDDDIIEFYKKNSYTEKSRAQLCIQIAKNELGLLSDDEKVISVYIGMPYCPSKCLYCSFTSNPIKRFKDQVPRYLEALSYEMKMMSDEIKRQGLKVDTVYFGGGTPTSVNDEQFKYVMDGIHDNFVSCFNPREFTVECGRPDSITDFKLQYMIDKGADRISINPQTMNDDTLKKIARTHNSEDVINIFRKAREMGHDNINMDLIVGLPGEGLEHIENTCNEIQKLKPDSITVHGLSIKRGSVLYEKFITNEDIYVPDQDEIIHMFECVENLASDMSMKPYYMYRQKNMLGNMENIGYSIKGKECIYNIEMIEDTQTILAAGANGISKFLFDEGRIERIGNNKDVETYIQKIDDVTLEKINMLRDM